jgi:mycofactocin system glycosyltransferase
VTGAAIPIRYRLRPGVRLEAAEDGSRRVVSGVPLSVLRVNAAAAALLERLRGGAGVGDLAADLSLSPERILELCETFRRRGLLETEPAERRDAPPPSVTVVVPTRDRAAALSECLAAVAALEYPRDLLDVVVVDDGSEDPLAVAQAAFAHGARLLVGERNRGPAAARNRGAVEADGEVLAFVDSDCIPSPGWLQALTPYFAGDRVGAVAGRTTGYFTESRLARYEEVSSPLDMGVRLLVEGEGPDSFYAPTCNLLVRRSVYLRLGGLREQLRLGEDVDFCWRLRDAGAVLVYAPQGVVRHKHPDRLPALLRRRADYGSSEAVLHALHPDKRGRLRLPPAPAATVALVAAGLVTRRPWLLAAALAPPLVDVVRRSRRLRRNGVRVPAAQVAFSTLRGHLSALYFVSFRLVRYHLWALAALGAFFPGVRLLGAACVVYAAAVDYSRRRPRLSFPVYLGLYAAEHAAYQTGVYAGRLRARTRRDPVVGGHRAVPAPGLTAAAPVPALGLPPAAAPPVPTAPTELAMRT